MESTIVAGLRVGTGSVNLQADDSMVVAGSILPRHVKGQEGELRAVAIVIEKPPAPKLAIVVCDVIVVTREDVQVTLAEIEKTTGIPAANILISATHTHHAPSTIVVHGYGRDEAFCQHLREGIVRAVQRADANLGNNESYFYFHQGEENTIGGNSRLLLADGTIWWVGPRTDAVRPTGPFDPQLPVLVFRDADDQLQALMYNHSTHTIGTCNGDVRSPSFYGLTAQELETELGGSVCFLPGAFGSTHNVTEVPPPEAVKRLKETIIDATEQAKPMPVEKLASIQRPFAFKVRTFDEGVEDEKVSSYCRKRVPDGADSTINVFRNMRQVLAPQQGQLRETTLITMVIGEVAIVGVPGELFTRLGVALKERSPFQHTYVVSLANDWMGYLPDREAHTLGGYQTWMGLHSYAEEGTGERMVNEALRMLQQLAEQ
ncbi:hypothetical protein F4X33_13915 [Candidatus Poribacteria bacterium]|nr:hypothetical protein [Candidatus Poribacteria bacterium]